MTYLIIFILLMFFAFFELFNVNSRYKKIRYWIGYMIVMLLAGLRYETGGDWTSYTEIFNSMEPIDQILAGNGYYYSWSGMEIGYKLLNSVVKFVVDNVQLLFFVVALIISTILFRTIPVYSPLPQLSVLVYFGVLFFALDMIVIRQGMAVAIIFYAYRYIIERKFWYLFGFAVLASLFHLSALIIIPLYFILNRTYSNTLLVSFFLVFNLILILQIRWMSPMLQAGLSLIINPTLAVKLSNYLTNEVYAVGRGLTFGFLVNIITFIVLILNRKRLSQYKYFNLFFNIFIAYLFVYSCMSELVEIGNRLKYYFMISFVVLLPMLVDIYRIFTNKLILYFGVCAFAFMYARGQLLELPIGAAFNPYQNYIIYSITNKPSTGLERLEKSDSEFIKERGQ